MSKGTILVVAAHPDDEILGCGATVARLVDEGWLAYTLILGEGMSSRGLDKVSEKEGILELKKSIQSANREIGISEVFTKNFPDNAFDTVPLLEIVKAIEKIKDKIQPDIIFTHFKNDLNVDHQITYQAVITATRPMSHEPVKTIFSFETLSATEWAFPMTFAPDTFFDVAKSFSRKIKAMEYYKTELRKFPHPRSVEGLTLSARLYGCKVGKECVEAFVTVRSIR